MGHKCFISYKKEDTEGIVDYKKETIALLEEGDCVGKSLDRWIASNDADYIMQTIRDDYLKDSTVTVFLIGLHSSENEGNDWQGRPKNHFIQRELQASLFNGRGNTRNGILGVVLPNMYDRIYKGSYSCSICGGPHNHVSINDGTVIREFSANYYMKPHEGCAWSENERYCVLVKWEDFKKNPYEYIEQAYEKRSSELANKVKIRNLR